MHEVQHVQPHGNSRSLPARCSKAAKQAGTGDGLVQMKWLWIELPREGDDFLRSHLEGSIFERLVY